MKAAVRRLHSPDADLATFQPDDSEDVGVLVQVIAGPDDGPGEESFDVVVCTPRWLERRVRAEGPLVGRHHLVVARYDGPEVMRFLTAAVESEHAATWNELALRLGRIGMWEFEDYRR
jgi:immunity protein 8 of polymorphic toxin system